jgi:polyhydroxyalkanoate synthesis regulator protein
MSKQNIAFFEQAMRMWSPFRGGNAGGDPAAPAASPKPEPKSSDLDDLKSQMQALQKQLETLANTRKDEK